MADTKITGLTAGIPAGTDVFPYVSSPGASPVTKKSLVSSLMTLPEGTMINGRILPSVASNNLTLAIKTFAGTDPSATDTVKIIIGGVVREIAAALSVTVNAAANSFNAGSTELAAKEVDYFAYLSYRAASSAVVIGFGRAPHFNLYSDFSATATAFNYGAFSTAPAATDNVVNIGRFAAILSAGAGYTFSVPTFTSVNLVQRPCFQTRVLTWLPTYSGSGSMTYINVTPILINYQIIYNKVFLIIQAMGQTAGTASTEVRLTIPYARSTAEANLIIGPAQLYDGADYVGGFNWSTTSATVTRVLKFGGNWTLTGANGAYILANGFYNI
jgi:hypothetical protein